jgi:uncharacterized protein YutE (UPF0331/DUF86 family)
LDELDERLARLQPLQNETRRRFAEDAYLRDIVERNLEVAAQACIDISHRIIAITGAQKRETYRDAILAMGELGIIPCDLALRLAPVAGFRNVLVHDYVAIDWDQVYENLNHLGDLIAFGDQIRHWLQAREE